MPAVVVGFSDSFVGQAEVGGIYIFRDATGEVVFSGISTKSIRRNKTASGLVDFSGVALDTITRAAHGEYTFLGAASPKQYTRTVTALLDLSASTAVWAGKSTNGTRTAAGGFALTGSVVPVREYIFTSEFVDSTLAGLIVGSSLGGYVGDGYVGYVTPISPSLEFSSSALRSSQASRFAYLGFPAAGIVFGDKAVANKGFNYTTDLTGFNLAGIVYVPPTLRFGSAVWYATHDVGISSAAANSSVWEGLVPVEPETPNAPASVWTFNTASGGTVIGGSSSVW